MNEAWCKASGATNLAIKYGNETPAMLNASNLDRGKGRHYLGTCEKCRLSCVFACVCVCMSMCVCVYWFCVPFGPLLLFLLRFLFNLSFALLVRFVLMLVARLHISVISAFVADIWHAHNQLEFQFSSAQANTHTCTHTHTTLRV